VLTPPSRRCRPASPRPDRGTPWFFYGLFGLLLFGPLAFGAVEPWSIFVLEAGAALLLLLWTVRQGSSGETVRNR